MSPRSKSKLALVLGLAAMLCLLWGLFIWLHGSATRQRLAEINARRTSLAAQLLAAEKQLSARLDQPKRATPVAAPVNQASPNSPPGVLPARIVKNPQLKALYERAELATIALKYGSLFRALHLSPEDQARLTAVLNAAAIARLNLLADAALRGDPALEVATKAQLDQQREAADAQALAILGPDQYAQFKSYQSSLNARAVVEALAGQVNPSDHPLTADQGKQLIAALASSAAPGAPSDTLLSPRIPSAVDWDAAYVAAAPILTSDQLATFRLLGELDRAKKNPALTAGFGP